MKPPPALFDVSDFRGKFPVGAYKKFYAGNNFSDIKGTVLCGGKLYGKKESVLQQVKGVP